jgi:hypothetical protein
MRWRSACNHKEFRVARDWQVLTGAALLYRSAIASRMAKPAKTQAWKKTDAAKGQQGCDYEHQSLQNQSANSGK